MVENFEFLFVWMTWTGLMQISTFKIQNLVKILWHSLFLQINIDEDMFSPELAILQNISCNWVTINKNSCDGVIHLKMSEDNAMSSFLTKTKQNKLCDMWMEEAMLMLFQGLFSSSDTLLFISLALRLRLCFATLRCLKNIYTTITINC